MPGNSFPTIGIVQNPFTIQVAGYEGLFTIEFIDTNTGFKIYDSENPSISLQISEYGFLFAGAALNINNSGFILNSAGLLTITDANGNAVLNSSRGFFDDAEFEVFSVTNGCIRLGGGANIAAEDGSAAISATVTTASLVGKTMQFKNGLLTSFS